MSLTPDTTDQGLIAGLETIAKLTRRAIEFDRAQRGREGLSTDADTHIYAWPENHSHGQLENWVAVFETAARRLAGMRQEGKP